MRPGSVDVTDHAPITEPAAECYLAESSFTTGPRGRIGVELEWLLYELRDPARPVPPSRLDGLIAPTALRGALTTEPGGQLELSSRPASDLAGCLADGAADLAVLRSAAASDGIHLTGLGVDPVRPPRRHLATPRYEAMERYFDRSGPDGRIMMASTAALQVCIEAGTSGDGFAPRWQAVHVLGPVLAAAFANSPLRLGRATGWRSTRLAVWSRLGAYRSADDGRTVRATGGGATAAAGRPPPPDPIDWWVRYALDADVRMIRGGDDWLVPAGLTFRDWLRGRGPRPATVDDLDYHLTTLFPPVRPRGWLELRFLDAQRGDHWRVATTAVAALIEDRRARDVAVAAAEPLAGQWLDAARFGLSQPRFARAARECLTAAVDGARRLGAPRSAVAELTDFVERYPSAGRCPADDVLQGWSGDRDRFPAEEERVPC